MTSEDPCEGVICMVFGIEYTVCTEHWYERSQLTRAPRATHHIITFEYYQLCIFVNIQIVSRSLNTIEAYDVPIAQLWISTSQVRYGTDLRPLRQHRSPFHPDSKP